jgi:hypothetical protein
MLDDTATVLLLVILVAPWVVVVIVDFWCVKNVAKWL